VKFTRLLIASLAVAGLLSGCGSTSNPTNVTPSLDTSPPSAPSSMGFVISDGFGVLSWNASPEADLAGYDVYVYSPDPTRESAYLKIASTSGTANSVTLPSAWSDEGNYFRIVAVDAVGNASGMSSPFLGIVDNPGGNELPPTFDPTDQVMKRH